MSEYENGNGSQNGNGIKARSASVGPQESSAKSPMVPASDIISQSMNSEHRESDIECLSQHGISAQTFNMIQTKERLEDEAKQRNMKTLEKETEKREL